ncbi:MAG: zinc metalloprotease HtpX [Acidimicrobiia bacterium]|nr:zinc metalloprotease HtpX [Acidimicrobiia bacterium]
MNNIKTVGLLALLGGLFVAVGYGLGGQSGAIVALGFAGLLNFAMYFFSDKLALRSARAVAVEEHELPQVYSTVRSLAQRENMPMPAIYFIDSPQPNAFATGRNPRHAAVAVTRGIMEMMTQPELEGVLAHELAHVKNRDILIGTIAATVGAALSFVARMAFWGGLGGNRRDSGAVGAIISIVAIIVAPLAAMIIQMAISRSREYQADRSGAETTGSPLNLASALQKLEAGTSRIPMEVNPSTAQLFIADPLKAFGRGGGRGRGGLGGMTKMFSTHPPIAERVERLTQMSMGVR